jgi:hypothetical protein
MATASARSNEARIQGEVSKDDGHGTAPTKTLNSLWQDAITRLTQENKVTIQELELAGDFQGAPSGVEKASMLFEAARHPKTKTDTVVTVVGGCLDWVDTAVGFLQDAVPDGVSPLSDLEA